MVTKRFAQSLMLAAGLSPLAIANTSASAVEWDAFVIRQANSQPAATAVSIIENGTGDGVTTLIDEGGEKTGYGTSEFDGQSLSVLADKQLQYDRIDNGNKYPYVNIWVTDNLGNYAVFTPFNPIALNSDMNNVTLGDVYLNVYENADRADLGWIQSGAYATPNSPYGPTLRDSGDNYLTLADVGHLILADPGSPYPAGVGTGAPKNGTGFNLIFGDTQSNFDQSVAYEIDNVQIVPEPASLALLGLGGLVMLGRRRRKA